MDKTRYLEKLSSTLEKVCKTNGIVEKPSLCPSIDLMLLTHCYAAFFSIFDGPHSLEDFCFKAQAEVLGVRGSKKADWPRDLNLVLLVPELDMSVDPALTRRLMDDRNVCRKFIVSLNGHSMEESLSGLPFWPPDELLVGAASVTSSVKETISGCDKQLISDLTSRTPGVDRIFEKICDESYSLSSSIPQRNVGSVSRSLPSTSITLSGIDIKDFRGIKSLQKEDMPLSGDIVFIYGPNGVGKTSIAEAVEWGISGQVAKLSKDKLKPSKGGPDPIVNVFSCDKTVKVGIHFSEKASLLRTKEKRTMVRTIEGKQIPDDRKVIDHVVGTTAPSKEARLQADQLRSLFRSSHMLSQHDIRKFLEDTPPSQRFDILTNMIGAEEYVRFKNKLESVSSRLYSHKNSLEETFEKTNAKLQDALNRLKNREAQLHEMKMAVTDGQSIQDITGRIIDSASLLQIDLNDIEAISKKDEYQGAELLAILTSTAVREQRARIDELFINLKALEQRTDDFLEATKNSEQLSKDITQTETILEALLKDLADQTRVLDELADKLKYKRNKFSEASRKHTDLAWLKDIFPKLKQLQQKRQDAESTISSLKKSVEAIKAKAENKHKARLDKTAEISEAEIKLDGYQKKENVITSLLQRLIEIQTLEKQIEELSETGDSLRSELDTKEKELDRLQKKQASLKSQVSNLYREYSSETKKHDDISALLARVSEFIDAAECPLCGREFSDLQEAKKTVENHLSRIPQQLKDKAHLLDDKNEELRKLESEIEMHLAKILEVKRNIEKQKSTKDSALNQIKDFTKNCERNGITLIEKKPDNWKQELEHAAFNCKTKETSQQIDYLRSGLDTLNSEILKVETEYEKSKGELQILEKECSWLTKEIEVIQTELIEHGFSMEALPQEASMIDEMSKARTTLEECSRSIKTQDENFTAKSLAVEELKTKSKKIEQELTEKKKKYQEFEAIRRQFISECQNAGVDSQSPKISVQLAIKQIDEKRRFLESLDKECLTLKQLTELNKVMVEIKELEQMKSQAKMETKNTFQKLKHAKDWGTLLKSLGSQIIERQVDAVGTHLKRLQPTTQRLYLRLNPHPVFGSVRIIIDEDTRELDVKAETSIKSLEEAITVSPSAFFSDAQMNVLAITVFLGGALRQQWSGFNTILIDDPIQQMDEMNVCAFLDLIRGLSSQKQFIIFTCSREFYLLAIDKLSCLNQVKPSSFLAYRLEGASPDKLKVHCDEK